VKHFISINQVSPLKLKSDHGGNGAILFRRLLTDDEFVSPIDFIDYTIIPTKCEIGTHQHVNNEEIYFIVSGTPLVIINGDEKRLESGSIAVVRSEQTHSLVNDTDSDVVILVIQVAIP
jgi:mannose-6-phosphate isomerase-like protein (cupin superfamily)